MTEEQLKNRKPNGQFKKGCISLSKGKKMSEETRRKLELLGSRKETVLGTQNRSALKE